MEFLAYRDLPSLAFVRCVSPIPGSANYAEGVGFSIRGALEKCRSEVLERTFAQALPQGERAQVLGIAAHPEEKSAEEHAWCESLETMFLEALAGGHRMRVLATPLPGGLKLFLSKVDGRWLALLRFPHDGAHSLVQAASKNVFRALLGAWTEFRNLKIYHPSAHELTRYTKGNRILGHQIAAIQFNIGLQSGLRPARASMHAARSGTHFIVYFKKEDQS